MSKKDFEKLSEAELLEKIAQAEKKESKLRVWGLNGIFIGLLVTVIGVVLDIGEFALIFGVIALVGAILYIASIRLRGKTESQVNAHLDDFYEAELNRVLGPRMKTSEMHISRSFMEKFHPVDERWNECQVWRYYESNYHGIHFSVANVELVERRKEGENADRIETKFEGVVLRCKDICDPALDIALRGNRKDHRQSDLISPAIFNQHFSARTADDQPADDLVTPQLRELVQKLESVDNREMVDLKIQQLRNSLSGAEKLEKKHKKLASGLADDVREKIQKQEDNVGYVPITSLTLHDGEATLAVNGYIYADGLNGSLKNLDIVRKRFITSLYPLERMISVLHDYRGKI